MQKEVAEIPEKKYRSELEIRDIDFIPNTGMQEAVLLSQA